MKIEMEITHPAHPNHNLVLGYTETPFYCHGCEEAGIGLKYKCQECEYELHKVCGTAQPTITHPFFEKREFDFYHQLPPSSAMRICDACGDDILGFVYHNACCGLDLHPWCANLPQVLDDGERSLYLSKRTSGRCHKCGGGKKGSTWGYRSQCRAYNLHVSCAKELLLETWLDSYFNNVDNNKKPS